MAPASSREASADVQTPLTGEGEEQVVQKEGDDEPVAKKQKRKGVVFGGEIGPSGKGAVNGKEMNGTSRKKGKKSDEQSVEVDELLAEEGRASGVVEPAAASNGAREDAFEMERVGHREISVS